MNQAPFKSNVRAIRDLGDFVRKLAETKEVPTDLEAALRDLILEARDLLETLA